MKVCVIGNSQISTIKLGWDASKARYPAVELSFFGSIAQSLNSARADGRSIVPTSKDLERAFRLTSGGSDRLCVDDYDIFLIVGSGLAVHWVVDLYAGFRTDDHVNSDKYLLSRDAFRQAAHGALSGKAAMHIHRLLSDMGVERIALIPNALPSRTDHDYPNIGTWVEAEENGDDADLVSVFEGYLTALEQAGTLVVRQPASTQHGRTRTADRYSAIRSDGHVDPIHTNAEFGSLLIEAFLEKALGRAPG